MKKLLLATALTVLTFTTAQASDAVVYEPVSEALIASSAYDWSGAYVGVQGGWAFGQSSPNLRVLNGSIASIIIPDAANLAMSLGNSEFNFNGASYGVQTGYNWQKGIYVFGVEGDINYIGLSDASTTGANSASNVFGRAIDSIDGNYLASIRARAGIAHDNIFLYGTAGAAFTDAKFSRAIEWAYNDLCPLGSTGLNRCHVGGGNFGPGYTLGGGTEFALKDHVTIKAEYLYTNFGKATFRTTNSDVSDQHLDHSAKLDLHTVRIGLNYKF